MISDTQAPSVELKIGEKTYQLCFTFGAILEAKRILRREGIRMNLLLALDSFDVDVDSLPALLYGGLRTHHPEIDYKVVTDMLSDFGVAHRVFAAICEAYALTVQGPDGSKQAVDPPRGPKE